MTRSKLIRSSDYGRFEIQAQAEKVTVVVRNHLTGAVIDAYRLTPHQSARIREAMEDAEHAAIQHRERRQQEERTGLVQATFIEGLGPATH